MFTVELYAGIRRAVMVDGLSRREVARRFGVHRNTISKMLQFSVPPGYRRRERPASKKLGPFMAWIDTRQARRWRWRACRGLWLAKWRRVCRAAARASLPPASLQTCFAAIAAVEGQGAG